MLSKLFKTGFEAIVPIRVTNMSFATFSAQGAAKNTVYRRQQDAPPEQTSKTSEETRRMFRKPNIFRPDDSEGSVPDMKGEASYEMGRDGFEPSDPGLNVGLASFYSLPKLEKGDAEAILKELRTDLEHQWTPSRLVAELDQHIISQQKAKRVIAQAVRNKYRMRQIDGEIRQSMRPSNILIHGRSGSGKTEIFRKIAMIYNAPFIRVEATKYTEVGYHGDDVTNMITDLFKKTQAELAQKDGLTLLRSSKLLKAKVDKLILKYIIGPSNEDHPTYAEKQAQLQNEELEEYSCFLYLPGGKKYFSQIANMKVRELRKHMYDAYLEELMAVIDIDEFVKEEIEGKGIVVIDEIDKLVRSQEQNSSTKASDEGVQYDLLPVLDGTIVNVNAKTKVDTRNILFVGAGAFEKQKPTDLVIELQGRLPVRAKMESLSLQDFKHILTKTKHNLLQQAIELLKTEQLNLAFEQAAIDEIARISVELNEEDNIGARRLRTVVDSILEDINFEAPDFEIKNCTIVISAEYVREKTKGLYVNRDFKKYLM